MDIRKWLKKPQTIPSASLQPGSSSGEAGEAGEHLPRPRSTEKEQRVQPSMEESEPPASPPASTASESEPGLPGVESPPSHSQKRYGLPSVDLGVDKPVQIRLKEFPRKQHHNNDCKRSFSANWYSERDWLEYSQQADAAFCFPSRKFGGSDSVFTRTGYTNWKHANDKAKGFSRHSNSKEHQTCMASWKEKEMRCNTDSEISTMVNSDQLTRNRLYVSAIVDIIEFLILNELPLRGDVDSVDSRDEPGSRLFLSLFDYTLRQNQELAKAFSTIPKNAMYTSHDIQNHIIELMSTIVTEQIVKDVGESWFTLKVDGTKNPTGSENVSIVVQYMDKDNKMQERLLSMQTTDKCDAESLTNVVLDELSNAGLDANKILSQCYDGASVMSGREGGMQKLIQNKLNREVPYIHCFNHQLHLVIVHAISSESVVGDFFDVCNSLYKFLKKPTVAAQYKGEKLKRLLEQRWTGHLDMVSVVLKSYTALVDFLKEIRTTGASADVKIEAVGLHKAITERSFTFLTCVMHKVLGLMDPANRMLQAEDTDLLTAVQLIQSASSCIEDLQSDAEFLKLWADSEDTGDGAPAPPKRQRQAPRTLQDYVVSESLGQREVDIKKGCKRLFYGIINSILNEMAARFSKRNGKYMAALDALDPASENFLEADKVKPLLDLTKTEMVEAQFTVAREFLKNRCTGLDEEKLTLSELVAKESRVFSAMPAVMTAFKHALTFGASTAMCENSFSTLKRVFTEHRRSMLHKRKAHLIQLAFENDLSRKFKDEWKEMLLRRFNSSGKRRLQLKTEGKSWLLYDLKCCYCLWFFLVVTDHTLC